MNENPLKQIHAFGQSIWLDFIQRSLMDSGELKRMINEDGLRGMTSNPAIFEKAIDESHDYDSAIQALVAAGKSTPEIYETLTVADVQQAADQFRPLYEETDGGDGYVSLEVSPHLARDTAGTLQEARHLWSKVARPNVLIKVPATLEGLPVIQQLISEGINVNVTLLFGLERYKTVADAYISGLAARAAQGQAIDAVASVASFFLSRIDVLVDPILAAKTAKGGSQSHLARRAHSEVAIASAKVAYSLYQEIFGSQHFESLAARGARPQRLLWASTSTKNPNYSDVKYVEALIGPETVNTIPVETYHAYKDHGKPAARLQEDVDKAQATIALLKSLDIDLEQVTQQLEDEGIQKFIKPFEQLMTTLNKAAAKAGSVA